MSLSDLQIASLHPQLPSKCCKKFLGNWMSWSWKRNSGLVLCWHWVHWSCRICIKDDITKLSLELELYLWASHHRILANHKRIFESQFYCDWSSCPGIIWTHNNFQRYLQIYINRQFWQSSSITVRASNIFKVKSRHHNATFTTKFVEQTEPHRIFCISMLVWFLVWDWIEFKTSSQGDILQSMIFTVSNFRFFDNITI